MPLIDASEVLNVKRGLNYGTGHKLLLPTFWHELKIDRTKNIIETPKMKDLNVVNEIKTEMRKWLAWLHQELIYRNAELKVHFESTVEAVKRAVEWGLY